MSLAAIISEIIAFLEPLLMGWLTSWINSKLTSVSSSIVIPTTSDGPSPAVTPTQKAVVAGQLFDAAIASTRPLQFPHRIVLRHAKTVAVAKYQSAPGSEITDAENSLLDAEASANLQKSLFVK